MSKAESPRLSRRRIVTSLAASAAVAGASGVFAGQSLAAPTPPASTVVEFRGKRQPGIAMPQQKHAAFVAFDLLTTDPKTGEPLAADTIAAKLSGLLGDWTSAAEALMRGDDPRPLKSHNSRHFASEAIADGLKPGRLTITVGLGPWVFRLTGLDDRRPRHLGELPHFTGDQLHPAWSDGDLLLQVCGDDPQVISEALLSMRARVMGVC
ncbi:MAG: Dyp-type peroxidase, partial [Stackebrandtia sp.]